MTNAGTLTLGFYGTTKDNLWLDNIGEVTVTPKSR